MWRLLLFLAALQTASTFPISSCEQLGIYLFMELNTLSRQSVLECAELLRHVINDADQLELKDADRRALVSIEELVNSIEQTDDSEELMDMFIEIGNLLQFAERSQELSESDEVVLKLLRQYGIEDFQRSLEDKINAALKRMEYHIDIYIKRMANTKVKGMNLQKWSKKYYKEQNLEIKLWLLHDFFEHLEECFDFE